MIRLLALLLYTSAAAQPSLPTPASPVPASRSGWGGVITGGVETFEADREAWYRSTLAVQRRYATGALALEAGSTSRNGETAPFVAADIYRTLGRTAYGNLRVKGAPGALTVARADLLAEVYVSLGNGLEGSLGVRHLWFAEDNVALGQASVAAYLENWVVRGRTVVVPAEVTAVSLSGSVRYLIDGVGGLTAPYVQVTLGQGQEPVADGNGSPDVRKSWVADIRVQVLIVSTVGLSVGATWTEDGTLTRWGADTGLVARF